MGTFIRLAFKFSAMALPSPTPTQFQATLGKDIRLLKDATGKLFGPEIYDAAQKPEGQITEVSYRWPKTDSDKTPLSKVSLITRANHELGCGGIL
jgi:hypothetical protein